MSEKRKLCIDLLDVIKSSLFYTPAEYLNFSGKSNLNISNIELKCTGCIPDVIMSIKSAYLLFKYSNKN